MNNDNLVFLLDSLKFMGFGEQPGLCDQLQAVIEQAPAEFQLETEHFFEEQCKLECVLFFRRGDRSDLYFFNRYEARLYYPNDQDKNRQQIFYISKGRGVSFKEAFNLLQGRSVYKRLTNKEGERYYAWLQLNFNEIDLNKNYKMRQFNPQYGYDLEKLLERYPIRELQLPQLREGMIRSLKKGNQHMVSFTKTHRIEKMLIEACPQYKTITIYRPAIQPGNPMADDNKQEWEKVAMEADDGDAFLWDMEDQNAAHDDIHPFMEEVKEETAAVSEAFSPGGAAVGGPAVKKRAAAKRVG